MMGVAKKSVDPAKDKGELMESNMDAMEVIKSFETSSVIRFCMVLL